MLNVVRIGFDPLPNLVILDQDSWYSFVFFIYLQRNIMWPFYIIQVNISKVTSVSQPLIIIFGNFFEDLLQTLSIREWPIFLDFHANLDIYLSVHLTIDLSVFCLELDMYLSNCLFIQLSIDLSRYQFIQRLSIYPAIYISHLPSYVSLFIELAGL